VRLILQGGAIAAEYQIKQLIAFGTHLR